MSALLEDTGAASVAEQGRALEARVIVSETQRLMATEVSVQIATEPWRVAEAEAALSASFVWFAEVAWRLSRFDAASELCALNRSAGRWFAASETLYAAVFVAVRAALASEGLFNPTLLRRLEALGYDRDFALLSRDLGDLGATSSMVSPAAHWPDADAAQRDDTLDAWRGILFDSARQRIFLPAGAALDLGGVAKGWAADVALERYCQPFPGALVNVGGDLRLHGGPQPGQPWRVGLRDPFDAHDTMEAVDGEGAAAGMEVWNRATLALSRGALATSGAARRWWRKDGARAHHLLDGRSGQPLPLWTSADRAANASEPLEIARRAPQIATVTALAPTGARAEVATKLALTRGCALGLRAVERAWARWGAVGPASACDAGVALIFTLSDGCVVTSRNLTDWLATWGTADAALPMLLNTAGAQPLALDVTLGRRRQGSMERQNEGRLQ